METHKLIHTGKRASGDLLAAVVSVSLSGCRGEELGYEALWDFFKNIWYHCALMLAPACLKFSHKPQIFMPGLYQAVIEAFWVGGGSFQGLTSGVGDFSPQPVDSPHHPRSSLPAARVVGSSGRARGATRRMATEYMLKHVHHHDKVEA